MNKTILFSFLITLLPISLFAPPKKDPNKKKNNDDLAFLIQVKKDVRAQQLNNKVKKEDIFEYDTELFNEFRTSRKISEVKENTHAQYLLWLQQIELFLFTQQDIFKLQKKKILPLNRTECTILHEYLSAWGDMIVLKKISKNKTTYELDGSNITSDKARILFLRYISFYPCKHYLKSPLSKEDILFLNNNKNNEDTEIQNISNAILKTNIYETHQATKNKHSNTTVMLRYNLIDGFKKLNLSQKFITNWFSKIITIADEMNNLLNFLYDSEVYNEMLEKLVKNAYSTTSSLLETYRKKLNKESLLIKKQISNHKSTDIIDKKIETETNKLEDKEKNIIEDINEEDNKKSEEKTSNQKIYFKVQKRDNSLWNNIADHIQLWHTNPKKAYQILKKKYSNITLEIDDIDNHDPDFIKMTYYHTFSPLVQLFIQSLAIRCEWKAEGAREGDISYNIPGQLTYTIKNEKGETQVITKTGVFSFGINDRTLFHWCFSETPYNIIAQEIEDRINYSKHPANNFDITVSNKDIEKYLKLKPIKDLSDEISKCIKENDFYVKIDEGKDVTIRLFKVKTKD